MDIDDLIQKYVLTKKLSAAEYSRLRCRDVKKRIEYLATRPESKGKLAKALFSLSNRLFREEVSKDIKRSAQPISSATSVGRGSITRFTGRVVSGGGVNGTGSKK